MDTLTVEQLKAVLRVMKVKDATITISGKKADLIERIDTNKVFTDKEKAKIVSDLEKIAEAEVEDTLGGFYGDCQAVLNGKLVMETLEKHKDLLIEHTTEQVIVDLLNGKPSDRAVQAVFITVGLIILPAKKSDAKKYKAILMS